MKRLLFAVPVLAAILGTGLAAPKPAAADDEQRTLIRLAPQTMINGVTPKGKAVYRVRPSRNRTKFKVQIEKIAAPNGSTFGVVVDGAPVGTITIALGTGELELSSNDGDVVPAIVSGSVVQVFDANNVLILSGAF